MVYYIYIYIHIYIYIYIYVYVYVIVSSHYLLVVGDDHVRGTREQMLLQVVMVRLSSEMRKLMGNSFI